MSLPSSNPQDMSRNFRILYYEQLGVGHSQEDQARRLEQLLNEDPIDRSKLIEFTIQFSLPAKIRPFIWKILLDILPVHKSSFDMVLKHRNGHYHDLKQALKSLRMLADDCKHSMVIVWMFLLENGMLSIHHGNVTKRDAHKAFIMEIIAETISEVIIDECDAFWIAKKIYLQQEQYFNQFLKLPKYVKYFLQLEDQRLFEHLCEMQLFKVLPYDNWFQTYFSNVLRNSLPSISRVWDKIIAGSCGILVFVCVGLLLTFSIKLKELKSSESALRILMTLSEDAGYAVIDKTMELYEQYHTSLAMELQCP